MTTISTRLGNPAYFALKARVTRRDGPRCHYCGRRIGTKRYSSTLDHVWPVALGGPDRSWNLVLACPGCNTLRGCDLTWCDCPHLCWPAIALGRLAGGLDTPEKALGPRESELGDLACGLSRTHKGKNTVTPIR